MNMQHFQRRAYTVAFLGWMAHDPARVGRFIRLMLLVHYGKPFSTKDTTVQMVPPGTYDYVLPLWSDDHIESPVPKSTEGRHTIVTLKQWVCGRLGLGVIMRAAFLPDVGPHGLVLLDAECPLIRVLSKIGEDYAVSN